MTAARYEVQAMAALSAVELRVPRAFLWFGRRVVVPAPEPLVEAIGRRLYADFYATGEPRPQSGGRVVAAADPGAFARALSQANCGRGSWQAGWLVEAVHADAITVVRPDGLRLLARAQDCRVAAGARHADVRVPAQLAGLCPGVWIGLGDTPSPSAPAGDLVRLCWNLAAAGAATFVARVTYALNGASLPFTVELLDDPALYASGSTAAVLLAQSDFTNAIRLLRPLLRTLGTHLAEGAPAFTKPLARGLAVAEEPARGLRFGDHRCRLLAEAIVAAGERGVTSADERLAVVRERFEAAGLSLDAPYLNCGSSDAYDLS